MSQSVFDFYLGEKKKGSTWMIWDLINSWSLVINLKFQIFALELLISSYQGIELVMVTISLI